MPRRGSAPGGRNRMTGASSSTAALGGVTYTWEGQKQLSLMQEILDNGLARVREAAENYWNTVEWTKERHPHMTGEEKRSGFFRVVRNRRMVVELQFGATAPWAVYEEYGTRFREGHHPIRNTLDRVGYRATDYIRAEARRAGWSS